MGCSLSMILQRPDLTFTRYKLYIIFLAGDRKMLSTLLLTDYTHQLCSTLVSKIFKNIVFLP